MCFGEKAYNIIIIAYIVSYYNTSREETQSFRFSFLPWKSPNSLGNLMYI